MQKNGSRSKKDVVLEYLSYMCKSKSVRSLLGVEQKPKRIEEAHSETRKLHRDLDSISMKTIHQ